MFSSDEVFVGPDEEDKRDPHTGRIISIGVKPGEVDAVEILKALPKEQYPDYVIVKADASRRVRVKNLDKLPGKKILVWGDSQHKEQPIRYMLSYAHSEPFDFIVTDHKRHHMSFAQKSGLERVGWVPALNYVHRARPIPKHPGTPVCFVGQTSQHHPYRRYVLESLAQSGIPLAIQSCMPNEAVDVYADSQISLNISLNGDLNLRVFEILAAGGFLLTDRLGKDSGLYKLFTPGEHFEDFADVEEAKEKISYYLKHPKEAMRIRRAGKARISELYSPENLTRHLFDWIKGGTLPAEFRLEEPKEVYGINDSGFARRVVFYEFIQELHLNSREVRLYPLGYDLGSIEELEGLPRVKVDEQLDTLLTKTYPYSYRKVPLQAYDVLVLGPNVALGDLHPILARFQGSFIAAPEGLPRGFNPQDWGWSKFPMDGAVFVRKDISREIERSVAYLSHEEMQHRLKAMLDILEDPEPCLELVRWGLDCEALTLVESMLLKGLQMDRNHAAATSSLAKLYTLQSKWRDAWLVLQEGHRVGNLNGEWEAMRKSLALKVNDDASLVPYRRTIEDLPVEPHPKPKRILVVTNLFPPQELGGYGRQIYEFSLGLMKRGHDVRVVTANVEKFEKQGDSGSPLMESKVDRSLQLFGDWVDGEMHVEQNPEKILQILNHNVELLGRWKQEFNPDWVLMGNLTYLGFSFIKHFLDAGIPVIHSVANATAGYQAKDLPLDEHFRIAPCSDWNGQNLIKEKYPIKKYTVVHPGARISRFYRHFRPEGKRLRLCYASLVMPFKGAQLLVEACKILNEFGVDFTCEIAGDSTDKPFVERLKQYVRAHGMEQRVTFPGFLDRQGLSALFNRSNVLVFPSVFQEPFGISQVEAMAAGLVVVTSATGGAKEIIRDRKDGMHFETENFVSLAKNLLFLAEHPELRQKLSAAAQERANEFSVMKSVEVIENTFAELDEKIPITH